jgi:hypothetical protein
MAMKMQNQMHIVSMQVRWATCIHFDSLWLFHSS